MSQVYLKYTESTTTCLLKPTNETPPAPTKLIGQCLPATYGIHERLYALALVAFAFGGRTLRTDGEISANVMREPEELSETIAKLAS